MKRLDSHFRENDRFFFSKTFARASYTKRIMTMAVAEKRVFRIEIDPRLCKGCVICVDFCPTNVLAMDGNLCVVNDLDACN